MTARLNTDATFFLLDDVAGWRQSGLASGLLVTGPDRAWALPALPGDARLLPVEGVGCTAPVALACPAGVAFDPCAGLRLIDAATEQVVALAGEVAYALPHPGPEAAEGIGLRSPRGLALVPRGCGDEWHPPALVVADTGNHRVLLYTAEPHTLVQVWGGTGDDAERRFLHPWSVAAGVAGLFVVDRGHRRVVRLSLDGGWRGTVAEGLADPRRVAISAAGVVAVADATTVLIIDGNQQQVLSEVSAPRSVAFAAEGRLFVGDALGLVHLFVPLSDGFRYVGAGVTGIDGSIEDLIVAGERLILVVDERLDAGPRRRLWQMSPEAASARFGQLWIGPLDSRRESCQWHSVELRAGLPEGTSVEVDTHASDEPPTQVDVRDPGFAGWRSGGRFLSTAAGRPQREVCLVQSGPGRHVWLRLTFRSSGRASPAVGTIKVHFPRTSYLQYLPAVYSEDPESRQFLDRFLSLFQDQIDGIDRIIDGIPRDVLAPAAVPAGRLAWLSAWMGVFAAPQWSTDKRREMLLSALTDHRRRGTAAGLGKAIADYTGLPPARILEHFRLRRFPVLSQQHPLCEELRLWSRSFFARLQVSSFSQIGSFQLTGPPEPGIEPFALGAHRFTVFFQSHPHHEEETRRRVAAVVEREKPAHTEAVYCPVFPRLRVGVQASLDVDAVVGTVHPLVLSHAAHLGYDTVLGCGANASGPSLDRGPERARIGITSQLL